MHRIWLSVIGLSISATCAIAAPQTAHPGDVSKKSAAVVQRRSPSPLPKFSLGMDRDTVHRSFGNPVLWYAPEPNKYFTSRAGYLAAASVWRRVAEVYKRRTATNLYELYIYYGYDRETSNLHPQARIESVRILCDRSLPAEQILADIPETKNVCGNDCGVVIKSEATDKGTMIGDTLLYTVHPTDTEARFAGYAASGWEGSSDGWTPSIELFADTRSRQVVDWRKQLIHKVWFGAQTLAEADWTSGELWPSGKLIAKPIDTGMVLDGSQNFFFKYMKFFMSCDKTTDTPSRITGMVHAPLGSSPSRNVSFRFNVEGLTERGSVTFDVKFDEIPQSEQYSFNRSFGPACKDSPVGAVTGYNVILLPPAQR